MRRLGLVEKDGKMLPHALEICCATFQHCTSKPFKKEGPSLTTLQVVILLIVFLQSILLYHELKKPDNRILIHSSLFFFFL